VEKITDKHVPILSRVIKSVNYKVKKNALWQFLVSEYGIGYLDGHFVILNRDDHIRIQELVLNQIGIDLLEHLPSGDRIQVSLKTGNEKFAAEAPGRHYIALTSWSKQLNINGQTIPLLPGASYRIDWRNLDMRPDCIIVVENLQAFDNFYMAKLPQELANAWVLYRGHNISSKAVKDCLAAMPEGIPIIAFSDYDPAGLIISKTTIGVTQFLLPEIDVAFQQAHGTRERFESQHASVTHLTNNPLPGTLSAHYDRLLNERLCVSQEQMLALEMSLLLINC